MNPRYARWVPRAGPLSHPAGRLASGRHLAPWFKLSVHHTPSNRHEHGRELNVESSTQRTENPRGGVDVRGVARVCDRLAVLSAGRLVAGGPPTQVLTPELLAEAYGIEADVIRAPGGQPVVVPRLGG